MTQNDAATLWEFYDALVSSTERAIEQAYRNHQDNERKGKRKVAERWYRITEELANACRSAKEMRTFWSHKCEPQNRIAHFLRRQAD